MAETSALVKAPKAASPATPCNRATRASAPVESKDPRDRAVTCAPASRRTSAQTSSRASLTSTSRGANRANSAESLAPGQVITRNSPVEISAQAKAPSSRTSAKAQR